MFFDRVLLREMAEAADSRGACGKRFPRVRVKLARRPFSDLRLEARHRPKLARALPEGPNNLAVREGTRFPTPDRDDSSSMSCAP
jgi:hypothetical protein